MGTSPSRVYLSKPWTPSLLTADLETDFILSSLRFDGGAEREATAQAVCEHRVHSLSLAEAEKWTFQKGSSDLRDPTGVYTM